MPRYGENLDNYYLSQGKNLSMKSILHLGMSLIQILEKVHESGFIYGDLKLDNVLFGNGHSLPD